MFELKGFSGVKYCNHDFILIQSFLIYKEENYFIELGDYDIINKNDRRKS